MPGSEEGIPPGTSPLTFLELTSWTLLCKVFLALVDVLNIMLYARPIALEVRFQITFQTYCMRANHDSFLSRDIHAALN